MQWKSHNNTVDLEGRYEVVMLDDKVSPSGTMVDAFGRLRISDAFTIFDSQHRYEDNGKWTDAITGTANASYDPNASIVSLNVDASNGSQLIRETNKVFYYQPGKSLLILSTFVFNEPKVGLRQRVGYFNDNNGIFLELEDTTLNLVLRRYNSGAVEETRVAQTDWNIDKFDGTQYSGISPQYDSRLDSKNTLDITCSQIFWIDIEWLGVGDVRCGFVDDGVMKTAHVFHAHNLIDSTYMTTACLPLRYEITNTSVTSSPSTLKQICTSIISEGGFNPDKRAPSHVYGRDINELNTLPKITDFYNIATIKLNDGYQDAIVIPSKISLIGDSNTNYQWKLYLNAEANTPLTFVSTDDPAVLGSNSNIVIESGLTLDSGFLTTSGEASIDGLRLYEQLERYLQSDGSYVSSTYTLAVKPGSQNAKIAGQLSWLRIV